MADLVPLGSRSATDATLAGGKAAGLARLVRGGLPVPAGVVLTTEAVRAIVRASGVAPSAPDAGWDDNTLAEARRRLGEAPWPARLERRLLTAARALRRPLAVRSSMAAEDGAEASWAGQLRTVLDVTGDAALLAAVRACLASRFAAPAAAYARGAGAAREPLGAGAMAVVVQEMVAAVAAGVAFSADPRTGRGCVVIEAAAGRGDRVVDGRVVPDRFVVDERGVIEDARPAQPGAPVLPEPVVTALAALVRECARRAAAPRDVEWAWDGARLALLQSRPITTLAGRHVYSNRLMREWTPGLVAPLVWSTNSLGMTRTVFRRVFTSLIGDDGFDYGTLVRRIHSRLYADLTVLGARLERAGFPPNAFEWMVRGEHARFRPPRPTPRLARAALRFAAFAWRHARLEREVEAFVTEHDAATAAWTGADWAAATPAALGVATRDALALHGRTQWCAWISALNLHLRARILGRMIARHAPDVDVKDLLGGLRERAGASPERELERIAHAAAPLDAGTLAAMLAGDDAAVRVRLDATPAGRMLAREVGELLARHGHLSANATDFTRPTWAERPGQVWAALGRHVAHPAPAAGTAPRARDAAVARIHARFGPVKRRVFDGLLRSTSRWAGLRERTSLLMSRDAATLRRLFLEHGRRLAAAGALDGPEDVFMLELEELEHANHGRRAPEATRALARLHRREMEEDARFEPEDTLAGEPVARAAAAAPEHHDYLVGIAASPGVRHLTARVVRDPAELPAVLTVDDALVAPFTDGGWTPLFAEVGAVVSESGGQLSHAAILAREYGLPAVVAVRGALAHIRDGQRIVVDGGAGRVYLHDGEDTGRRS